MQANFEALILGKELNLNKIAQHFAINRKFKWEDSLVLDGTYLRSILPDSEHKVVYLFYFGSAVFINFEHHEVIQVVRYLKEIEPEVDFSYLFKYVDHYQLTIDPCHAPTLSNDYIIANKPDEYHLEIISIILAKSVALEKVEIEIGVLLDQIESVIDKLNEGQLAVSDKKLAKMSANILGFKLDTISYIMLLDKPDITWENEEAGKLFDELMLLFELNDRYNNIHHKTAVLMDITNVFAGLAQSSRGTRLEWAVIILIAIEIVLSLFDMFIKGI